MPLKKITFKPGVNRENTRYTTEGGWYDSNYVRFRQGTPEKIGGYRYTSQSFYRGVARSLWSWVTLDAVKLLGVGTSEKFYLYSLAQGSYYDITPFRAVEVLTNPFTTTSGSVDVEVDDPSGGFRSFDTVYFYPDVALNGLTIYGEYALYVSVPGSKYYVNDDEFATASGTGGGTVYALYNINSGPAIVSPTLGWGSGGWGFGPWGVGVPTVDRLRLWSQGNFGEDLVFAPRGGTIYYWDASYGFTQTSVNFTVASPTVVSANVAVPEGAPVRFVPAQGATMPSNVIPGEQYYARNSTGNTFNISLTPSGALIDVTVGASGTIYFLPNAYALQDRTGAASVPIVQTMILVSDISRFVFAFGANDYGDTRQDKMLVRWSDQDDPFNWTPAATNQAGFLRLSRGSEIIAVVQSRQEILVWTDSALYSLQYVGAPIVWSAQLLADNISIAGQNSVVFSNDVAYWMGKDKFYKYNGRVQTLRCDVRRYVFSRLDKTQYEQTVAGTVEQFNEIWWWYVGPNSNLPQDYVTYNFLEDVWYFGRGTSEAPSTIRTAWIDVGISDYPIAATGIQNLVYQELGTDDYADYNFGKLPIFSWIVSSQFDLDDGNEFMFIWRVLPDITFDGSDLGENPTPRGVLNLLPLKNSGSGYTPGSPYDPYNPAYADNSVGWYSSDYVTFISAGDNYIVEQFTGQIYLRVRGRQMSVAFSSQDVGVTWQLGSLRLDMRPDGRR